MFHVLLCFSYTKIPFYLYLSFQVQSGQTWFKILTLSLWKWFRFNNNSLSAYYLKFPNRRFWNFYNLFSFSSFLALKVKYLRHLLINHPNFFSESSYRNYLKLKKNILSNHQENLENIVYVKFELHKNFIKKLESIYSGAFLRKLHKS